MTRSESVTMRWMDAETPQKAETDPLWKALTHSLAFWAVVVPVWMVISNAMEHQFAFDVHFAFVPAARAVLHGASPYSGVSSHAVKEGIAFLYPPLGAYLFAPFTVLPTVVAGTLATVLVAATIPLTLLVLEIRDWRCYAVAFIWIPTIAAIQSANVTLPMVLGLALVWRYRNKAWVVALVGGFIVALKLFFWPLLVWLVATRRYRTAAWTAAASLAFVFVPWAGIGFAGLGDYIHLLRVVAHQEGADSYSLAALVHYAVPSWTAAVAVETLAGLCVVALALVVGRRGRDRDAFVLAILAMLVFTPLLEIHYFAVLLVVVALYRPRFGAAWLAPLLIWGATEANNGAGLNRVHVSVAVAATLALVMTDRRPRLPSRGLRPEAA
jgi:hypothetical protein